MTCTWETGADVKADIKAANERIKANTGYVPSPIICIDYLQADHAGVVLIKCDQERASEVLDAAHKVALALPKSLVVLLPEPFDMKALDLSEAKELRDKLNEAIYDKEQGK